MYKILIAVLLMMNSSVGLAQEKYCRYTTGNKTYYGKVLNNKVYQLDDAPWNGGKITRKKGLNIGDVKLLYPCEPQLILGLGKSYKESWTGKEPFKTVRWFLKPPSSAASPGDSVVIPSAVDALKVEVELVIVIGKKIKNGNEEEAAKSIFGYTIGNDIVAFTESYYEKENSQPDESDALLGSGLKIGDGFAPFGPFIYTGIDWQNRMRKLTVKDSQGKIKVNYENNTSGLMYSPAKIISDLSKVLTLSPGDIVFSGTTKAFVVKAGDTVKLGVEGMGEMENTIIATTN